MIRSSLAAALAASTIAAAAHAAESGAWIANGPPGASVYCIAPAPSSPSTVYIGTGRGVWRGDRGGAIWHPASAGLPADRVQAVAVDPTDPDTLYAGTVTPSDGSPSDGIFKSQDGGASWVESNDGLFDPFTLVEPLDVAALSIDPSNAQVILAGTRFSEIFRSTDGGASWTPRTFGGYSLGLETLAFARDPGDPQRVYAASSRGLLLSLNGGESWSFFGNAGTSFYSIAVDPTSPSTVYAGNATGFGLGKSLDGGATWSAANGNLPQYTVGGQSLYPPILAVAVDPSGGAVYITTQGSGAFRSTDGGSSWTAVDDGLNELDLRSLAFLPGSPATILAGGNGGGVYRSANGAAAWSTSSLGLDEALVSAVVANPGTPGTAYASAYDGVYATRDGAGWSRSSGGLPAEPVASLALRHLVFLQPGDAETLLAGTLGAGLWASTDGGATWSPRDTGLADDYISAVTVDPTNALTLYAGTDHPYDGSNPQRVYKSTDSGATWRQTGLDASGFSIGVIAVDPQNGSRVAAVSRGIAGFFQSADGGSTWSLVTPGSGSGCGGVNTVHYEAGGGILLGVTNGVCRSSDGGATWAHHSVATLGSVYDLLAEPLDPSTVYAAVSPSFSGGTGGVFRSTDGGLTWAAYGTGLSTFSVRSLALDASRTTLYAGILRGGVAVLALDGPGRAEPDPPPSDRGTRVAPPR